MLVRDEAVQTRATEHAARAQYADRVNQATVAELCRARIMEDGDLAPNNPFRQLGRIMTPRDFETQIVAKLGVPNLLFEVHPTNPSKRCMYQVRGAAKELICVYENNPMPEMSIITGVVKWVPDLDYLGEDGRVVRRGDLGAAAPAITNEQAQATLDARGVAGLAAELDRRAADAEPSRIGMRRIVTPGAEKVRGWRTVLVYMMQHGLCSPEQIHNVAGGLDRASWAGYMGDTSALGEWLQ